MNAAARLLPLFSMVSIALAAAPAAAQPGATWTESGFVTILVRNGGVLQGREASGVLENDVIEEIVIGRRGTAASRLPGSLSINGIGTQDFPRDLGEIDLYVGELEVTSVFADSLTSMSVGSISDTEQWDPSVGALVVRLSQFLVPVNLRHGTVTCEQSTMDVLASGGRTVFSGCAGGASTKIDELSPFDPPVVTVDGSALNSFDAGGGTISVSDSSIDTFNERVRGGDVTIGLAGPVSWDDDGTLTVAPTTPNPLPVTFLLSSGSTIETKATLMAADDVTIQGASTWRSFDPMRMISTNTDVRSASIVDARSDLEIAGSVTIGSDVAADSRIDVGGNLLLSPGTLTIEDGGFVDVAGTLTISPTGTLNLNGGTLRVANLVEEGTLNENGGTLILPEAGATASAIAAALSLAIARSRSRRRCEAE
jgi:hypothetical protein